MHFALLAFIFTLSSWAHQSSLTTGGNELFWTNPTVPVAIHTNTSDMSSTDARNVILDSMAQWNVSSVAKVNSVGSSNNEIKFVSDFPYGSGVIGITEISYNNAGAISKAVISLNDDYYFHNQSGFYPTGQVFLGDVVTHELGHLFGLSHSEVLDSSMFYSSFPGQSTVSFDDQSGVRHKYDTSSYGMIRGSVRGGNDIGVLGAHVQAISRRTGKATAVVSDEDGNFEIGGLNPDDTYYLYTAPIKNSDSLPGYFSNVQDEFCPAAYVGSFFSKCGHEYDGKPQGISISAIDPIVDVGAVTINCSLRADENYNVEKLSTTFDPVTIYTYDTSDSSHVEQAFVGWFRNPTTTTWSSSDIFKIDLSNYLSAGKVAKVSLVSFPFGSQLEYEVTIRNTVGQTFFNAYPTKSYSATTETYNTDFETYLPLSNSDGNYNVFEFRVRSKKLSSATVAATFPSLTTFSSGTYLPYLIIVSLWEQNGISYEPIITQPILSDNAACLDAPFTYAVSQAKNADDSANVGSDQAATAAGCGTIEPPGGSGPGSSLPLMTAGFFMAILMSSVLKSRKKFLS